MPLAYRGEQGCLETTTQKAEEVTLRLLVRNEEGSGLHSLSPLTPTSQHKPVQWGWTRKAICGADRYIVPPSQLIRVHARVPAWRGERCKQSWAKKQITVKTLHDHGGSATALCEIRCSIVNIHPRFVACDPGTYERLLDDPAATNPGSK